MIVYILIGLLVFTILCIISLVITWYLNGDDL